MKSSSILQTLEFIRIHNVAHKENKQTEERHRQVTTVRWCAWPWVASLTRRVGVDGLFQWSSMVLSSYKAFVYLA